MRGVRSTLRACGFGVTIAVAGAALAACGSSDDSGAGGKTEISYLVVAREGSKAGAQAEIDAFEKANPDIIVKLDTFPEGADGDNLVKTKLSTGEMDEVFNYNAGALFRALQPDNQLTDLSGEAWAADLPDSYKKVVSTDKGMYGAPLGQSSGGGVLYNRKVYDQLKLSVPTTWSEFIANGQKIKAAEPDITPVLQAYGDAWTAQVPVLADFANVTKQDPAWAQGWTAGQKKFGQSPALTAFTHLEQLGKSGLVNKDYASMTNIQALKALADGKGAQYPMISDQLPTIAQDSPDAVDDIGFFALPADDAANTTATIWQPGGLYIPRSAEGDKLEAAKKFVAFVSSSEQGCQIQSDTGVAIGAFVSPVCKQPSDVSQAVKDVQKYLDDGQVAPALEFLSEVKGPNLDKITVQVGSGITSGAQGAKQYDDDARKQAQQLGLSGW
ncbi:extracellular solute-binding protein [Kineosporia mesophila]|uniref:Extracellular solute-binding protein n=1 Tax=Kineosporia mesophila TaxID=566012 RepID=A0ABP7ABX0_9ACTN|nr:extracellular solute-binding protein [Kineosporia mesophila]MCD5351301.1 extracellular solute-binding protein [Kineosporia mesophila]